jgi:hypothetical protein
MNKLIDDICDFKQNFIQERELKMLKIKYPSLCPSIREFPIELENIFNYKLGKNWVIIPIEDRVILENFKLERFGIIE